MKRYPARSHDCTCYCVVSMFLCIIHVSIPIGDDGTSQEVQSGVLMKESENIYSLWCSGRVCCEGMLVTLKLLKRQDLVSTISHMFRPTSDQIIVKLTLEPTEIDTFVFCLANKKVINKLQKDMVDLVRISSLTTYSIKMHKMATLKMRNFM